MRAVIVSLILLICLTIAPPAWSAPGDAQIYSVILSVTLDQSGQVRRVAVAKVIAPMTGAVDPVDITVSKEFIDDATRKIRARNEREKGKEVEWSAKTFYTYFFLDPKRGGQALEEMPGAPRNPDGSVPTN